MKKTTSHCFKHYSVSGCTSAKSLMPLKSQVILCPHRALPQRAVGKAEELVKAHQEYQRGLRAFEDWLEQEQEKLGCYTQLEGDVDMLEETLQKLQVCK